MTTVLTNIRICSPGSEQDGRTEIGIDNGRFVDPEGLDRSKVIDGQGQWLIPGLIDLRANLREPGLEHKGTIASETAAAVAGGVTTLVATPTTDPVVDSPADVRLIIERAKTQGRCRVLPTAMLTQGGHGEHLSEMAALTEAGCVALAQGARPFRSRKIQYNALKYAASLDLLLFLDPEDPDFAGGCAHAGTVGTGLGLSLHSPLSETLGLQADLALVEATGVRAHFSRLTTADAVSQIRAAKARGLPVSCDVSLAHLLYTEEALQSLDPVFHLDRPLRRVQDRDALRVGILDGTIDAIVSDHSPHEPGAKLAPFPETETGMSLLDTILPLLVTHADAMGIPLVTLLDAMTRQPAALIGLSELGVIRIGALADCVLFDPASLGQLSTAGPKSAGRNHPAPDATLSGWPSAVWIGGQSVFSRR